MGIRRVGSKWLPNDWRGDERLSRSEAFYCFFLGEINL
ncbi:hypothetical protein AWB71_06092 [Caballeronia peredens]|nr:hypothetical protein AWB71_06092 [Caballeronia peredens]